MSISMRSERTSRGSVVAQYSTGQITETERKCLEVQSPEELAKSKYDLPVEFHAKIFEDWIRRQPVKRKLHRNIHSIKLEKHGAFEKYILSQKTSIMFLCESFKPNRKSRFEFIKPELLINALEQRPKFFEYRQMAMELLRNKTLLQLKIIGDSETCASISEIPHRVFSWSAEDYYTRRTINNTVWLEVYERDFHHCLEMHKFKFDLEELEDYLDLIMCGALCESSDFSFDTDVIQPLEDASDLLSVYDRLLNELEENRETCRVLKGQHGEANTKAVALEEQVRASIVQQMADASVLYPIMYRYQKAWYEAQADQVEIKHDDDLNKRRDEIAKWIHEIQEETSAMQNTLNMYYTEIEYYKTKISEYSAKFETEYEDLDNAVNYKKLSMSKIEAQRKFCLEQMQIFRAELAERNRKKLIEQEEKRRQIREAGERELLKLSKGNTKKEKQKSKAKSKNRRSELRLAK